MNDFSNIVYEYLQRNMQLPSVYTFAHGDRNFIGLNKVFSPVIFEDSFWFAENIPFVKDGSFLEIGCGTGFISITAALNGCSKVIATDINPDAVTNSKLNSMLYGFDEIIDVFVSNVFEHLQINSINRFSTIFWNVPFIYTNRKYLNALENSVFDIKYKGIQQYISNAINYISPNGKVFFGFSSSSGDINLIHKICKYNECSIKLFAQHLFEDGFSLELYEIIYHKKKSA